MAMFGTPRLHDVVLPPHVDSPALIVDGEILLDNISRMAAGARERQVALRPHFKTHKTAEIAHLQAEHGAVGQSCATLGEAAFLADHGFTDVFVAYPVWPSGPRRHTLRDLHQRIDLTVGVDSVEGVEAVAETLSGCAKPGHVLIEVDSGGRRTGVSPDRVESIGRHARRRGLDVVGVFTHGGHSYAPEAAAPAADDEVDHLSAAVQALASAGIHARVVSSGSTPTALVSARSPVTEVRPGTYVLGDRQQAHLGSCTPEQVALFVAGTVVSRAVPGQFVVDAGTKCLGRESQPWLEGFAAVAGMPEAVVERLYDHHGVCRWNGDPPSPGTRLALIPNHVCPVVNLATHLWVLEGQRVSTRWEIGARAVV